MTGSRAQLSAEAIGLWGERIQARAPDAELVAFDPSTGATPGEPPEVAWLSVDVLRSDSGAFVDALLSADTLRWVQTAGAGHDARFYQELLAKGVRLTTSHVNNVPIAEFVVRAVLDRFQRADLWRAAAREHRWEHHEWREVSGSTWLVVGVGAIGGAVAERARGLGARVVGIRRTPHGNEPVDEMVGPDALSARLPEADVVVLTLPATEATRNLVDDTFLTAMAPGSVLVNIARGSIVDEDALVRALDGGRPDFAVLDVVGTEPLPPDSPLWDHPSIVITPHSSAGGDGRFARGADLFAENLRRYGAGEPLLHEVRGVSEPAKKPEKTGICLSGGGIRAAAFGLGALQAIQEKKGLVQGTEGHPETAADYLVAVSGGSYIAGAISMARSRYVPPEDEKLADAIEQDNPGPGHPRVFAPGSDEVEHVRRRAQYLLRGGAGLYEVASQFVVRLLLNLCFVLVPVVVLGMLSALLYRWRLGNLSVQRSPLLHWPMWIALGALVVALAWNIVAVLWPGGRLGKVARTVTWLLLWTAFAAFLAAVVPPLVYWLTPHTHAGTSQATTHSKAGRVAVVATAGSIVTAIAALLSKAQPLVGAIGRFPRARAFAAKAFRALVIVGAAVLVPLAAVALYVFTVQQTVTVEHAWQALLVVVGLVVLEALLAYMAEPTRWSLHPFYEHRLMSCFCLGWRAKEGLKVSERNPDVQYRWSGWDLPERPELLIAAAANVSTFGSAPAGQNVLPFVLSKHEIGFTNGAFTASTSAEDDTTAARVAPPPTTGGRLDTSALINACRDGKDRLRWRDGKRNLWNLTLPAAVAITGAAFSPLMGKRTIPPVRMLLALFNLRLGVWLPNPQNPEVREAVTAHGAIHRAPHAVHLLREYFGLNSRTSPFIYVSDGGHYENLGLVETLRRGCTTVYCIDASGDPPGQPRTLTEAMRLAAAELSITWDRSCSAALAKLAVTDEPDAAKTKTTKITTPPLVQRTWTRLSFHTADKREGHVIVIKAGLGPETPEHLRSFQRSRPAFPYDGTGNQLFRADRFDAYRELGYSSAMSALAQPIP